MLGNALPLLNATFAQCARCRSYLTSSVSYRSRLILKFYPCTWTSGPCDSESLITKDGVHVLKTSSCRFWIEEPCDGHKACVEYSPNDIQSIAKAVNSLRGNVDDNEVREPVGSGTKSDALVARPKGHDLRRIHPRDRQDSERKDVEEQEGKGYKCPLRLWRMRLSTMGNPCGT